MASAALLRDVAGKPPRTRVPARDHPPAADGLDAGVVDEVLTAGSLELTGRLLTASNASFLGSASLHGVTVSCVYKPVAGERPLWDFPDGTLAARERAARLVSEAGGWHVVPPTVMRDDARFGPGMVQQWVDVDPDLTLVDVVGDDVDPSGWIVVLEADDETGHPVWLVHADDPRLRDVAVLDAVLNNADRKGGHILLDRAGAVWGCDHGVTFHREQKLRTVLWGWSDERLRGEDVAALRRLIQAIAGPLGDDLAGLLTRAEVTALHRRAARLLETRTMPSPAGSWRAIPWPAI